MKPLFIALLASGILCGCRQENIHDKVREDLSNRTVDTNQPQRGTDPNVRIDTQQGQGETTSGTGPGSTATPRGADTQGGGSATGAGGGGPGYRGDLTNNPPK